SAVLPTPASPLRSTIRPCASPPTASSDAPSAARWPARSNSSPCPTPVLTLVWPMSAPMRSDERLGCGRDPWPARLVEPVRRQHGGDSAGKVGNEALRQPAGGSRFHTRAQVVEGHQQADARGDLIVGGSGWLAAEHAVRDQSVDMVKQGGQ